MKPIPIMFQFTSIFKKDGTTIYPGIILRGDLIETDTTVSIRDSNVFKDIPKDILQPYTPSPLAPKTRKK